MARIKKPKNWPIDFVSQRMEAPAKCFTDKRARVVNVFCLEHTDRGTLAHATFSIGLYTFLLSDLKPIPEDRAQT